MFSEPYDHQGARRRGINSVEIGIMILQCVVDLRGPSSLKDIALRAKMDSSQAHRYVSSLVNCGMLKQDPTSGHYDLGPVALRTGLAAAARYEPLIAAEDAAQKLCEESGATVMLTVWSSNGPTVLRWYHGRPPVYTTLSIGSVLPVTTSATGLICLAFLPDSVVEPLLEGEGWKKPLSANQKLVTERQRLKTTKLATVDGTVIPGLRAHAAPILGIQNALVAVLTVVASDAIKRTADQSAKSKLTTICAHLSSALGAV